MNDSNTIIDRAADYVANRAASQSQDSLKQACPPKTNPSKTNCMRHALICYSTQSLVAAMLSLGIIASNGTAQAAGLGDLFSNNATQTAQNEFLSVDKAFTVVPMQNGNILTLSLEITPQHYLYKDKFTLKLPAGVTASPFSYSQTPHTIDDPTFGKVAIFDQKQVTATATLTNTTTKAIVDNAIVTWQGCAKAGLCYPPQRQNIKLTVPASLSTKATGVSTNETKAGASALPQSPLPNSDNNTGSNNDKKITVPAIKKSDAAKVEKTASSTSPTPTSKVATTNINNANNTNPSKKSDKDNAALVPTPSTMTAPVAIGLNNGSDDLSLDDLSIDQSVSLPTAASQTQSEIAQDGYQDDSITATQQTLNADTRNATTANTDTSDDTDALIDRLGTPDPNSNNINAIDLQNESNTTIKLGNVVDQDPFGLAEHPLLALLLLFLAGLGLSFTACVLPMLPIVSNIIARQHEPTAKKGLLLSGSYALGVAFAYGLLGAAIAVFGESLGIIGWLQNPVVLLGFAAVFTLLALYMLELFTLSMPRRIKQKLHTMSQLGDRYLGSSLGSFLVGILSALVVSPCVSAPLLGALLAVSTIGNPLLGFAALFMLGLGVSAPLMLLGVSQGNLMPKAGAWMHWVKQGFALMLFAVALLLVERVFISAIMLIGWAIWFAVVAGWAWQWQGRGKQFTLPLACILAGWSACVLVGAAAGSRDSWQPLAVFSNVNNSSNNTLDSTGLAANSPSTISAATMTTAKADIRITNLPSLKPILAQYPKVLVDVTADWCVECRIMDKTLFTQRPIQLQSWQVVKLDITKSNADTQQVLQQLRLFGPPALLYFVNGELQQQQVGAIGRDTFEKTLAQL